jgi:hypothetical protein
MAEAARNELSSPLSKFCLALETYRRTDEGRVRTAQEMLAHFFPYDESRATDRLFCHLPRDVRGPILTGWGIRGRKAALRDTDDKVLAVVHDALIAGDIDAAMVEQAITPELCVLHLPLTDWWSFYRAGRIGKRVLETIFTTAYELGLFDAAWFLGTVENGDLRGVDVLSAGLNKEEAANWIRRIAEGGDASPRGMLAALGWDKIVAKTDEGVLFATLDALAAKVGLLLPGVGAAARKSIAPQTASAAPAAALVSTPPAPAISEVKAEAAAAPAREAVKTEQIQRRPEPSRPPEASIKPGSRASVRPPPAETAVREDTATDIPVQTDEYPDATGEQLRKAARGTVPDTNG